MRVSTNSLATAITFYATILMSKNKTQEQEQEQDSEMSLIFKTQLLRQTLGVAFTSIF